MKSVNNKICSQVRPGAGKNFKIDAKERLESFATPAFYQASVRHIFPGRKCDVWLEAEADFLKEERR